MEAQSALSKEHQLIFIICSCVFEWRKGNSFSLHTPMYCLVFFFFSSFFSFFSDCGKVHLGLIFFLTGSERAGLNRWLDRSLFDHGGLGDFLFFFFSSCFFFLSVADVH